MNEGDYIRTKYGIAKIVNTKTIDKYNTIIKKHYQDLRYELDKAIIPNFEENEPYCYKEDIIKSSPNIIDIIEVGDIVKIEYQGWHQVSIKFETLKFFDDEGTEYL